MKIRILFGLVIILTIISACKKDKPTRRYQGIVLHGTHNTPVANANVYLYLTNQDGYNKEYFTTHTNDYGEYAFIIEDKNYFPFYSIGAQKENLLQDLPYSSTKMVDDTVLLDDPSYLRIIVRTRSVGPYSLRVSWYFIYDPPLNPFPAIRDEFARQKFYINAEPGDTLVNQFAYRLSKKARVVLAKVSGIEWADTLIDKEVILQPLTTTETLIEY